MGISVKRLGDDDRLGDNSIKRLGGVMGAEVSGIDLSRPLDDEARTLLREALFEHLVLVLHDQHLTPAQQVAFAERFSGPVIPHVVRAGRHLEEPSLVLISNLRDDKGAPKGVIYAGQHWHSDYSYLAEPTMVSALYAVELPEIGGDTGFASMYMAYDSLSDGMKEMLEGLRAVHDYEAHFARAYADKPERGLADEERAEVPPVEHPVVPIHPHTKRRFLYLGEALATRFVGMTEKESEPLMKFLAAHATHVNFCYRHTWRPHDMLIWDNYATQHIGVANYSMAGRRLLHRATIAGEPFLP